MALSPKLISAFLTVAGVALVGVGVSMVYLPAGLIAIGLISAVLGLLGIDVGGSR